MIFVTVGTQLPFPRLISAMNAWSAAHPDTKVIAQTGDALADAPHLETRDRVDALEFASLVAQCDVLVAHAGMGSILSALDLGKQVIVMPREARLGEHRNDHQLATVRKLCHIDALHVVADAAELDAALTEARALSATCARPAVLSTQASRLIGEVQDFVQGVDDAPRFLAPPALARATA